MPRGPVGGCGGARLDLLVNYDWPGNVRALRHAAERAVILADGDGYRIEDFPLPSRPDAPSLQMLSGNLNLDQLEKQMIERALRMHHFNISLAASELGLSRGALYRRMEKHGLSAQVRVRPGVPNDPLCRRHPAGHQGAGSPRRSCRTDRRGHPCRSG